MNIPGINVLLMGAPGTGKTHSLRTWVETGVEIFIVFTEPGMEVLSDTDPDQVHWHYVKPANPGWNALLDNMKKVNTLTNEALQKLPNIAAKSYGQAMEVLTQFQDFECQRTGKKYGDVTEWGTDRVIVLDSLSGLNIMMMDLVVGSKPVKTLVDWGVAMDTEERVIDQLTLGTSCHFVLTAHLDKQIDEVMGGVTLVPNALGRKVGPSLGRFFSDVILAQRSQATWTWSTAHPQADLKARNLQWKDGQPPSFVPLYNNWKTKQEKK